MLRKFKLNAAGQATAIPTPNSQARMPHLRAQTMGQMMGMLGVLVAIMTLDGHVAGVGAKSELNANYDRSTVVQISTVDFDPAVFSNEAFGD